MKIEDRVSNYMALLNSETPKPGNVPKHAMKIESTPVAVSISSTAAQMADDEVRRERLDVIRQQLAEGSYNISGKDVADKILNVLKG